MKTIIHENTVVSSGITESVAFNIKQEGLAHIFSILRNSLYSDKFRFIVEYVMNGVDAHIEAGKPNLPVKVTLPTKFNSVFRIRDFGLGLTESDIQNIYCCYGTSSKQNNNNVTGMFGLGSKSAFAYGDSYVIVSYVNGTKTTYNAYIDVTQIGQIAKLSVEDTTEPNGVEISIPIKDVDIQTVHDKSYNFFKYFKVRPEIDGAVFDYSKRVPLMEAQGWRIYSGTSIAVMGNLGYPLLSYTQDPLIVEALTAGIEVDFDIGELEVSASREQLQWTGRTKAAVEKKLLEVVKEAGDILNKRFSGCTTLFDALKLHGQIMDYGSSLYPLRGLLSKSLTFKGNPIKSNRLHFNDPVDGSWIVRNYEKTYRGDKVKSNVVSSFDCDEKTILIYNDLNIQNGVVNRVYNHATNNKRVYLITYKDAGAKTDFEKVTGIVDANCILLSSLPKISLAANSPNGGIKNPKHSSSCFTFDFVGAKKRSSWNKNSDFWTQTTVDVDNDAGVYVIIEQFCHLDKAGRQFDPFDLNKLVSDLEVLGIKIPVVYGFKQKQKDAVLKNKNMVNLFDHVATELTNYFTVNSVSQKLANRLEFDAHSGSYKWIEQLMKHASEVKVKSVAGVTANALLDLQSAKDKKILDLCVTWKEYVKTEKPEAKVSDLAEAFEHQYPMVKWLDRWEISNSGCWKAMAEYIDLIG